MRENARQVITTMFNMQKALDETLYKEHGVKYENIDPRMALYDELGEFIHELKGDWCWWKKTQNPVDREKVLEELVDVYHFALMIDYNERTDEELEQYIEEVVHLNDIIEENGKYLMHKASKEVHKIVKDNGNFIKNLLYLTNSLSFTLKQVYDKYLEKNAENYKRLKENY